MANLNSYSWDISDIGRLPIDARPANVVDLSPKCQYRGKDVGIPEIISEAEAIKGNSKDFWVQPKNFHVREDGVWDLGVGQFVPTHSAFRSLAEKLSPKIGDDNFTKAAPYFTDMLNSDPVEVSRLINKHFAERDSKFMFRTYGSSIIAILSGRFVIVDNLPILKIIDKYTKEDGGDGEITLERPYIGPEGMNIRMRIGDVRPQGADGPYGIGVSVSNSQIGGGAISVQPFIMRNSCTNSISYREGGASVSHVGTDNEMNRKEKLVDVLKALAAILKGKTPELLNRMIDAQYEALPKITSILDGICEEHNWGRGVRTSMLYGMEGNAKPTRQTLVNGISYAASHGETTVDAGIEMENIAAQILFASNESLNQYATVGERLR